MKLYHATLKSKLDSIFAEGLDPRCATGKMKVTWLHTKSKRHWAIAHAQKRHKCNLDDVVLLQMSIPRSQLQKRWRGIWTTDTIIYEFNEITDGTRLAESPITEEKGDFI